MTNNFSRFQSQWCHNIFDKMLKMNVAMLLSQEFDKRPSKPTMDFKLIKRKLEENSYMTASDWIRDVNLIWFNEKNYYEKDSHYYHIIVYLQNWFERKVQQIPKTEMDAWLMKFQKVQSVMVQLMKTSTPK